MFCIDVVEELFTTYKAVVYGLRWALWDVAVLYSRIMIYE